MSKRYRFHSPSVAALVAALAAALEGMEKLPPEDRSVQSTLTLLDHVLGQMRSETPELRPVDWREIEQLREQLQNAIEGGPYWAGDPHPGDLIH